MGTEAVEAALAQEPVTEVKALVVAVKAVATVSQEA
jgi:hypothetical protein